MRMRMLLGLLAVCAGAGCTMVSRDRVFPKFTWYWSHDAQVQREENALSKRQLELYQAEQLTNKVVFPDK